MHRSTIERIADQQPREIIQATKALIERIEIEQRLRWMLVIAITSVNQGDRFSSIRCPFRSAGGTVAQHNCIGIRLQYANSIFKGLPFINRGGCLWILYFNRLPT